jgi:hypothetical protein
VNGQRLANLRAALGFLWLPPTEPELQLLHRWLDTWTGVGLITVGGASAWRRRRGGPCKSPRGRR